MDGQGSGHFVIGPVAGSRRGVIKALIGGGAAAGLGIAGEAGLGVPAAFAGGGGVASVPTLRRAQGVSDAPWMASHGLDDDAYQAEFDRLVADGYRLRRISGYSIDNTAYFASIWEQSNGPAWEGRHGLTGDEYQVEYETLVGQGFLPIDISGYEIDGEARYAAIFEEGTGLESWDARHGLSNADYQATVDELMRGGAPAAPRRGLHGRRRGLLRHDLGR